MGYGNDYGLCPLGYSRPVRFGTNVTLSDKVNPMKNPKSNTNYFYNNVPKHLRHSFGHQKVQEKGS